PAACIRGTEHQERSQQQPEHRLHAICPPKKWSPAARKKSTFEFSVALAGIRDPPGQRDVRDRVDARRRPTSQSTPTFARGPTATTTPGAMRPRAACG